jgi:hypothetical protein
MMYKDVKKVETTVKRVLPENETRLPISSLDELAIDRRRARQTMRNTSRIRWAKFIAALQQHRRAAEREVRDGQAPSQAAAFWYQNETMITAFLYLVWETLSDKSLTKSRIEADLAVSKPFVNKLVKEGKAGGFLLGNLTLTDASLGLYFDRIDAILDMPEVRDLADSIHVMNVAESKAERLN